MFLADASQRKKIIQSERAECADYAQCCEHDVVRGQLGQRGEDRANIDTMESAYECRDRKGDDKET